MPEGTGKPLRPAHRERCVYRIDRSGGTFVDAVILTAGNLTIGKAPTTPEDPAKGIVAAVGAAAARGASIFAPCCRAAHVPQRNDRHHQRDDPAHGFKNRPDHHARLRRYAHHRPRSVCAGSASTRPRWRISKMSSARAGRTPTGLIRGVSERMDCFGTVIVPLDLTEAEKAIDELVARHRVAGRACSGPSRIRRTRRQSRRSRGASIRRSTSSLPANLSNPWASMRRTRPPWMLISGRH